MPRFVLTAYEAALKACGFLAGLIVALLALAISLDVLLRNLGLFSSAALLEITEYALYVTTFLAAPWALSQGSHVRVDLLLGVVSAAAARLIEIAADLAGLAVVAVLGWHGLRVTLDSFNRGDVILKQLAVVEWWLLAVIPLSCLLLTIEFLRRLVRTAASRAPTPGQRA